MSTNKVRANLVPQGNNYTPWRTKLSQKGEDTDLDQILRLAILAPSSHNSQPWILKIKDNTILVYADFSRRLNVSDTNDRQLHISIGCAITNATVAADYFNYLSKIEYFPDSADKNLLARITFIPNPQSSSGQDHLAHSILTRVTNRNRYEADQPPNIFFEHAQALSTKSLGLYFIQETSQKTQLADIVLSSLGDALSNVLFRKELSQYVKSNLTSSEVGMPGFGLGFPLPVSLLAPTLIKYVNVSKLSRKQDELLLKQFTPLFGVICTETDGQVDWIKAGQAYEHVALIAESMNLKTAILAAPIQIGDYYKSLQKILSTFFRPQVFFRLGYTNVAIPHSPRISP